MFLSKNKKGFYYLYFTDENGKRKCITTKTKLKSEANKFLSSFRAKLKEKIESQTKPILLRRMIFEFLMYSESVHSYNHTITLKSTFKGFVNYLGDISIAELTKERILDFIQKRSREVSPHSVKRDIENLSSLFNWAIDYNYLIKNLCKGIKRPRLPEKLPVYYTRAEFPKLIDITVVARFLLNANFSFYSFQIVKNARE
ncbi:MAG: phage integrase N-terminal SAM-like domain-containing protein [Bacteroidetes bacterium]|nr:phage integrase N-terminal SAM-like domain-containing protein [Bacteroidota bacterium]